MYIRPLYVFSQYKKYSNSKNNLVVFNCFFKIAAFYKEYFDKMKDYFHPNTVTFIDHYTDGKGVVELPAFHGCGLKNRNGTKKLVDYGNGNQCICGVWSDENSKIKSGKIKSKIRYLPYDKIYDPG